MDSAQVLQEIANQVAVCEKCALHFSRKNAVPGEGPFDAEIMMIGEGPGFHENEQGRPFVGAAGQYLNDLLEKCDLKREQVFIGNVVKCRPPGNRDPLPEELSACSDYLERQIQAIDPLVIVTLGRYSMARYLHNAKISDVHGQARWMRNRLVVAMYHPAAALHQPSLKTTLEQDFSHLPDFIKEARQAQRTTKAHKQQVVNDPGNACRGEALLTGLVKEEEPDSTPPPKKDDPTQLSLF